LFYWNHILITKLKQIQQSKAAVKKFPVTFSSAALYTKPGSLLINRPLLLIFIKLLQHSVEAPLQTLQLLTL